MCAFPLPYFSPFLFFRISFPHAALPGRFAPFHSMLNHSSTICVCSFCCVAVCVRCDFLHFSFQKEKRNVQQVLYPRSPRALPSCSPRHTCIFSFCKIKRHSRQPHAAAHHQQQRASHKTLSGRSETFKAKLRECFKRDTCAANSLHSARPAAPW